MKIIDKYIIKSFFSPYIISFLIAEFVLILQFMWRYIDEFAGRGLTFIDFAKLLLYYGVTVIPMSVPITVLISSVMVYGNIAERYELSSMKSAGISLIRIFMPGFMVAVMTFAFSIFVSNYLRPKAAFNFLKTFTELKRKRPTLNIQEKVFNKDFEGFAIQVDKKAKDGVKIENVKIYNETDKDNDKYNIIVAKNGELRTTDDGKYFSIKLYDVHQYWEQKRSLLSNNGNNTYPLYRSSFKVLEKSFDLSVLYHQFSGSFFSKRRDVMNTYQLLAERDTFNNRIIETNKKITPNIIKRILKIYIPNTKNNPNVFDRRELMNTTNAELYSGKPKSAYNQKLDKDIQNYRYFAETFDSTRRMEILSLTKESISFHQSSISNYMTDIELFKQNKDYWTLGLHQQYCWALVCIIFLFIGAPLGSIIRKGGYGYPVLVAIIFFMIFILLSISGEKLNRSSVFTPFINGWLPVFILLPASIFFTFKSLRDAKIEWFGSKLIERFQKNKK